MSVGHSLVALCATAVLASGAVRAQDEAKKPEAPRHEAGKQSKTTESQSWSKWIQQLGSTEFKERDEARSRLLDAGADAVPELKKAPRNRTTRRSAGEHVPSCATSSAGGRGKSGLRRLEPGQEEQGEKSEPAEPPKSDRGPWRIAPMGPDLENRFEEMFPPARAGLRMQIPRGRFFEGDFFKDLDRQLPGIGQFQGEGRAFSMKVSPDGVRVETKERGADGKEATKVYEAPDLEAFRGKYTRRGAEVPGWRGRDAPAVRWAADVRRPRAAGLAAGSTRACAHAAAPDAARRSRRPGAADDRAGAGRGDPAGERLGVHVRQDLAAEVREVLGLEPIRACRSSTSSRTAWPRRWASRPATSWSRSTATR
jgi:hypothetical protein